MDGDTVEIEELSEGRGQTVAEIHAPATRGSSKRQTGMKKKAVPTPTKKSPKKKTQAKAKNPSAIQVVRSFMEEQSDVNRAILNQLAALRDKCGFASPGLNGGESNGSKSRGEAGNGNEKNTSQPVQVISESEDSDVDSDMEARIQSDMNEAQARLQPKFVKNSEPGLQSLLRAAEHRQTQAIRPSTHANNIAILRQLIAFLAPHGINFKRVNDELICAFLESLAKRVKSPATIKNYLSALSTTYNRMGLSTIPFKNDKVNNAILAMDKTIRHIPIPSTYVTVQILKDLIAALRQHPIFPTIKFLFLTMFISLLRQSNFMPATIKSFDPTRQLTRDDIQITHLGAKIRVKWEKNLQSSLGAQYVVLPRTNNPDMCPVTAYSDMCLLSPTTRGRDPLIMFANKTPVPLYYIQKVWSQAVRKIGKDPRRLRMHGLRRGGATLIATSSRAGRDQIKEYGRWRSQAYQRYIADPTASAAYRTMAKI